jgi:toxin ParE1/3/4
VPHKVVLAPEALDDLRSIYDHVADDAGTGIADGYQLRIRAACLGLADFPGRGTPRDALAQGLRSIAFERRATIYYRVTGRTVEIVRIFHAGRDVERAFEAD